MGSEKKTGAQIRQEFIDFFVEHKHTFVPSSSLVPGGDQTLLFTNAGMVQFKDVFLGTDKRPYTRAANSQKCMRVAGKHNDLEDVGRDNTHHTFFEMLGNWSFGDYYKKEAIAWAWQLLTEVWGLPKERLWATCFEDEKGQIPRDDEAADEWLKQPGFDPDQVLFFGRKDNFWEMAETGPCGPNSEIHIDRGPEFCNMQGVPGHECQVNGDCTRFLELWNLVFIQYNRIDPNSLEPLPARHVDTGMGFERIVSVLQDVDSNYKTDLLKPLIDTVQKMTGHSEAEIDGNFTQYRVIADHSRAASFLIADGVVPGNTGRNYVCRMIVRRAARFGGKLGLKEPFLADVAKKVIEIYGDFYPELVRNKPSILNNLTREEERFQRTLESGVARLESMLTRLKEAVDQAQAEVDEQAAEYGKRAVLPGDQAFELYATFGLPLELTRDIVREQGMDVDESGFHRAMEQHRLASGAGEAFGPLGGEDVEVYRELHASLQTQGKINMEGVEYNPYDLVETEGEVLALIRNGQPVEKAQPGDRVEIILPQTGFYVESGGQVSDTGWIASASGHRWMIEVEAMRRPAAGIITHIGKVVSGEPHTGDLAVARVDLQRRQDIMRNHTATHLLHAELHAVLGEHARQAGSLVAPDRLRFDFTHPEAVTPEQLEQIEAGVNQNILGNYPLVIKYKPLLEAMAEGAMALFGEKYGSTVRTIAIHEAVEDPFSYELCGGTHVNSTADIGLFLITSESSAAAGIRRIEAVTGRAAYNLVQRRFKSLKAIASSLNANLENVPGRLDEVLSELSEARKETARLRRQISAGEFLSQLDQVPEVAGVAVLTAVLPGADAETLREMTDRFRQRYAQGVAVLASVGDDNRPILIAAITDDLVKRGLHAGNLVKFAAQPLGGGGGGRPNLAQAGGKDASKIDEAFARVRQWVEENLKAKG